MNYLKKLNKLLKDSGMAINAEKIVKLINRMNNRYIMEDSLQKQLKEVHEEAFDYVLMKHTEPEKYNDIINTCYKLWFLFSDQKVIVCTSYNLFDVISRFIYIKYLVLKNRFQNWYFYDDYKLKGINSSCKIVRGAYAASDVLGITVFELLENIQNAVEIREHHNFVLSEMNK